MGRRGSKGGLPEGFLVEDSLQCKVDVDMFSGRSSWRHLEEEIASRVEPLDTQVDLLIFLANTGHQSWGHFRSLPISPI